MLEFMWEAGSIAFRLLRAELPDCAAILDEIKSGKRSLYPAAGAYIWLCRLTSGAMLIRISAWALLISFCLNWFRHFRFKWPPYDFGENDTHYAHWALSLSERTPSLQDFHYCEYCAVASLTAFVAAALAYYSLAWSSKELVKGCCPLFEPPPPKPLGRAASA